MALFQSFFAGSGAEDGHPAPVPQKRAELLRLVYRERFWNLLTPNLLYAAFCVPAFLLCAFCLKAVFGYWENGEGTLEQILPALHTLALGMLVCRLPIGLAGAGMARVMRSWARDEHASGWGDFWAGLAQNARQGLLLSLPAGLFGLAFYWYAAFLSRNPGLGGASAFPAGVCLLLAALWAAAEKTAYVTAVSYRLKTGDVFKNSLLMTLSHLPAAFGVLLACLLPALVCAAVICWISFPVGALLAAAFYLTFGFARQWLFAASFANRLCEETINPHIAGAGTRIGMGPKS